MKGGFEKTILEDFKKIVVKHGFKEKDFDLTEVDKTKFDDDVSVLSTQVTVTLLTTGKAKTYESGHRTSWLGEFERDLNKGLFL